VSHGASCLVITTLDPGRIPSSTLGCANINTQPSSEPTRLLEILIADDEPQILSALKRILERRGHRVMSVESAYDALDLLAERSFDAAMIDARMPGNGLAVVRHLEADTAFSGPIVLMTGALSSDPSLTVGPAVLRLQKPFRFLDVVPLIEDAVQG